MLSLKEKNPEYNQGTNAGFRGDSSEKILEQIRQRLGISANTQQENTSNNVNDENNFKGAQRSENNSKLQNKEYQNTYASKNLNDDNFDDFSFDLDFSDSQTTGQTQSETEVNKAYRAYQNTMKASYAQEESSNSQPSNNQSNYAENSKQNAKYGNNVVDFSDILFNKNESEKVKIINFEDENCDEAKENCEFENYAEEDYENEGFGMEENELYEENSEWDSEENEDSRESNEEGYEEEDFMESNNHPQGRNAQPLNSNPYFEQNQAPTNGYANGKGQYNRNYESQGRGENCGQNESQNCGQNESKNCGQSESQNWNNPQKHFENQGIAKALSSNFRGNVHNMLTSILQEQASNWLEENMDAEFVQNHITDWCNENLEQICREVIKQELYQQK